MIEVDGVEWYQPAELADQFAGVTRRNIYDWVRDQVIPADQTMRVGRDLWVTWDAADQAANHTANRGRRRTHGHAPASPSGHAVAA